MPTNNVNRGRLEMLDAMGITVWVPRASARTNAGAAPAHAAPADAAPVDNAVATMDWDTLAAAVSRCTRCALHSTRTRTVFGVGNRQAQWLIVGEGPGQEEDRQGEPFVGPAGKLLNAMLTATGRARGDVYIANIVKCRPPNNRNPEAEEAARCADWLSRQIALLEPKLIVAVGRIAAQNLLGVDASLAQLRGRIHRHPAFDIPVVVTYHPAYLLRQPQDKGKAWADLQLAMRVA